MANPRQTTFGLSYQGFLEIRIHCIRPIVLFAGGWWSKCTHFWIDIFGQIFGTIPHSCLTLWLFLSLSPKISKALTELWLFFICILYNIFLTQTVDVWNHLSAKALVKILSQLLYGPFGRFLMINIIVERPQKGSPFLTNKLEEMYFEATVIFPNCRQQYIATTLTTDNNIHGLCFELFRVKLKGSFRITLSESTAVISVGICFKAWFACGIGTKPKGTQQNAPSLDQVFDSV